MRIIDARAAPTSRVLTVSIGGADIGTVLHKTVTISTNVRTMIALYRKLEELKASIAVGKEAIVALIKARDFLGYQLSFANGAMTETQLNECADEYLDYDVDHSIESIARKTAYLSMLLGAEHCALVDAELVSTLFKCELDVAEASLSKAVSILNEEHVPSLVTMVLDK